MVMVLIEFDEHALKMVLKLVYYGPAQSGKTTNLFSLHDLLAREGRGELMVLDTVEDRTIYFDLLPFFYVSPAGMKIKLKVYTVPGQVRHDATRKAVLQRADGVVFVADSQTNQMANNFESFENLERNLGLVGLAVERTPLVVQFNKRDLLGAIVPEADILTAWGPSGLPVQMASALTGAGVLETFRAVLELIFDSIDLSHGLTMRYGVNRDDFMATILRTGRP
jgi:signal recognition particle receptor subunit beta